MSVAFPPHIEAFVESSISTGNYASREELIIAAVDMLRQREAAVAKLRADIEAGWDGPGIPMEEAFARLRTTLNIPTSDPSHDR